MEVELYDLQKVNISLENNLTALREKLSNVYKLLHVYKKKCDTTFSVIKGVKNDIYFASGNIQDFKKLKDGVKKLYFKYIKDKDFEKARKNDEDCVAELKRQKIYLEGIVKTLDRDIDTSKQVNYGEGMIYMEMNWSLMDEIYKIRKKLKGAQSKIQDMETLLCVRMAKIYSPRQAHKIVQRALKSEEEVKEECEITMEEATGKATLMREELDALLEKIADVKQSISLNEPSHKKKKVKEALKFNIPSII